MTVSRILIGLALGGCVANLAMADPTSGATAPTPTPAVGAAAVAAGYQAPPPTATPAPQKGSVSAHITVETPPTSLRESKALVPSNAVLKSWAQQAATAGPSSGPAPVYRTMADAAAAGVNPEAPPVKAEPLNLETPAAPFDWQRLALLGGGLFAGLILLFSLLSRAKRTREPADEDEDE